MITTNELEFAALRVHEHHRADIVLELLLKADAIVEIDDLATLTGRRRAHGRRCL
jgi:hypothetical protein